MCPGLIDAHMHIESTLLMPGELARVVVPRGTTAVIADPHEIANVLGGAGIELMITASDWVWLSPPGVPRVKANSSPLRAIRGVRVW